MAKQLVTLERVREAAEQLIARGVEPSIINVQQEIGGGSYTTVKRFLGEWQAERQEQAVAVEVPSDLQARSTEFVQALWRQASTLADERVAKVQAEKEQQIGQMQQQLAGAEQTIARLEGEAEQQTQRQGEMEQQVTQLQGELGQARGAAEVAEARAAELEKRAGELRADGEAAQRQLEAERQARAEMEQHAGRQLHEEIAAMKAELARLTMPPKQ